jgi:hypothetical protein
LGFFGVLLDVPRGAGEEGGQLVFHSVFLGEFYLRNSSVNVVGLGPNGRGVYCQRRAIKVALRLNSWVTTTLRDASG